MIVREKIPAKVNLTLDVLGKEGNFHNIKSLVASINLFDTITLLRRNDKRVTLKIIGLPVNCPASENNAVKAAMAFIKKFDTKGVNIIINKKIPVGGGLGGSSADIAGVLKGMKRLFNVDGDLSPLANELGSDSNYMLNGGYAVMSGRGVDVKSLNINAKLYLLLISSQGSISAKACYNRFDELDKSSEPCTEKAITLLKKDDVESFSAVVKNDLDAAANTIVDVTFPKLALKEVGALSSFVSGSGPTVYGVFKNQAKRDAAYLKLSALFGNRLIKANTLSSVEN